MSWHEEVLNAAARRAAARLAPVCSRFYLAGGTGLALRLGHRVSLDLDLFSADDGLGDKERAALLEALGSSGDLDVEENKDGTCHLVVEGTRVSLLRYPYPLLKPTADWRGMAVASVEDIAAMKVSAVIGRGAKKDFVDLYEVCGGLGLESVLEAASKKYDHPADFLLLAARALVFFEDAEKGSMPRLLKKISWERVKSYFEKEVPRLVGKLLR